MISSSIPILLFSIYIGITLSEFYVLIGGYGTEGMSFKRFIPNNNNSLQPVAGPLNAMGNDPETFAINVDKNITYTAGGGNIVAIPFDKDNSFAFGTLATYKISTNAPTWISTDISNTFVYSASYGGDTDNTSGFQVFKIDTNSGYLNPSKPIINHPFGAGSHSHCILPNPNNPYHFYIADFGRNVVEHYEIINNKDGTYSHELRSSLIMIDDGAGPRTLAFNPNIDGILYVSLQKVYKVSVLTFDTTSYKLIGIVQTYSTSYSNTNTNIIAPAVGHVDTDRDGKYLYVANRDSARTNKLANNIAIFQLNRNNGYIVDYSLFIDDNGGNIPRQFKIDPSNNYMFIANQFGPNEGGWPGSKGNVAIYKIDHNDGGKLIKMNIYNYSALGYNGIGVSWIDFIEL